MTLSPRIANEIARLLRDPDALRPEWERMQRERGYDPQQPRVPAGNAKGGQWTSKVGGATGQGLGRDAADVERPLAQPAFAGPPAVATSIEALLALFAGLLSPNAPEHPSLSQFNALSARNTRERRAVFKFNARQFLAHPYAELNRASVESLDRDQVRDACKRLEDVQSDTDRATANVNRDGGLLMSPQQRGTAIHKELENLINGRPELGLQAEVSRVKSDQANVEYGRKDSVRIDVLECAPERTACAYDIKTGESRNSGLTLGRMYELAEHALKACPKTERVVVTEVRPSR